MDYIFEYLNMNNCSFKSFEYLDSYIIDTSLDINIEDYNKLLSDKSVNKFLSFIHENEEEYKNKLNNNNFLQNLYNLKYKKQIKNNKKLLTKEEEYELIRLINQGDEKALDKMIECNEGLIRKIAYKYSNLGLETDDLIQEGKIGLLKAIECFDVSLGYKFSTYATYWIKQRIVRELQNTGKLIRIPCDKYKLINQIKKYKEEYNNKYNKYPSNEEIINELGISEEELFNLQLALKSPVSMHVTLGDDTDATIEDLLPDYNTNIESDYIKYKDSILDEDYLYISSLNAKEILILKYYFGYFGKCYKQEEIGKIYGVTSQRIGDIIRKSLLRISNGIKYRNELKENKNDKDYSLYKYNNLYYYFSKYKSDEIEEAISRLNEEDYKILKLIYGDDFRQPDFNYMEHKKNFKKIELIYFRMENMLRNIKGNGRVYHERKRF